MLCSTERLVLLLFPFSYIIFACIFLKKAVNRLSDIMASVRENILLKDNSSTIGMQYGSLVKVHKMTYGRNRAKCLKIAGPTSSPDRLQ